MRNLLFVTAITLGACTSSNGNGTSSNTSQLTGDASYRDATTSDSGAPQQPSAPPAQQVDVRLEIQGTGTIPQIDPKCATDPVGAFVATYSSNAEISNGGGYAGAVASSSGTITTPSGCAIQSLTVGAVTSAKLVADLQITTENCQTYCEARARADAETQCGATASAATCRVQMESSLAASCQTTCTSQAHSIHAEADVTASALGQLTADELKAASFADLETKLEFATLVDASGHTL